MAPFLSLIASPPAPAREEAPEVLWPGRDSASLLRAVKETLRQGDGEIVVEGPDGPGRIFVSGHRVAWVVAGGDGQRFTGVLAEVTGLPASTLRDAWSRAVGAQRHPGEALIADGVVSAVDARTALRVHNGRQLARVLASPIERIRVDQRRRPYSSALLFTLEELLEGESPRRPVADVHPDSTDGDIMTTIQNSLQEIMTLDGAIAAAVVDWESGLTLGTAVGAQPFDIELAASGNTSVVKGKMAVMKALGLPGGIEDILITLGTQYHLIRPLSTNTSLFLYVAIDKARGNLGLARHRVRQVEATLTI